MSHAISPTTVSGHLLPALLLLCGQLGASAVEPTRIDALDVPLCPGGVVGDTLLAPEIEILGADPGNISGSARNIDSRNTWVVLWALTNRWYVQPLVDAPYTTICADGSWDNWTHDWDSMVALVVDSTYTPGATRDYHPSLDPGVLAWDEVTARTIQFSGYRWSVRNADSPQGPGPNYFSDDPENVWVDAQGRLHLRVTQRDGLWRCAEIYLEDSLGYGTYTFRVASSIDTLDGQMVFAGFVYETDSQEIDIELSHRLAAPHNAQFVVQPYYTPGNLERFDMPGVSVATHQFAWSAPQVEFRSWTGRADEPQPGDWVHGWTYGGADNPPPGNERMHFNLWLVDGAPPQSGLGDEVIVESFDFAAAARERTAHCSDPGGRRVARAARGRQEIR